MSPSSTPWRRAGASLAVALLAALPASASFHVWDITEIYSNADGSVQFIELFSNANNQDELEGRQISSNGASYTFPMDLGAAGPGQAGNNATANRFFLIATPDFALQPGAVTPDYVLSAGSFLSVVSDLVDFAGVDSFGWGAGELPTDGMSSLNEPFGSNVRTTAQNSPTNYAGETGQLVPEPGAGLLLGLGLGALARTRRRSATPRS